MSSKQTVAVVFGSRSVEHDVSIVTATAAVIKPLELSRKFEVIPVYITKDGKWYSDEKFKNIKTFTSGEVDKIIAKKRPVSLYFDEGLKLLWPGMRNRQRNIDVVFPATHGTYGEDGSLMGLCEMANVAYVGCDVESSAIAMDKIATKMIVKGAGLKTVPDVICSREDFAERPEYWIETAEKSLGYPMFVKPPHLGSSIGVTRVINRQELQDAIEVAFVYDSRVLIELGVPNLREATLPIMGFGSEIVAGYLEEPLVKPDDFFDFDTKYMNQGSDGKKMSGGKKSKQGAQSYSRVPADFDKKLYSRAEKAAIDAYRAVGCNGIARVDILIDSKEKEIYINEINPMPGSLYAHNWRAKGISSIELVEALIYFARKRHEATNKLTTAFSTSFLKQF